MDPITTMEVAKEIYEAAKTIKKVYNVSKEMKTVAEAEGKDQIKATRDFASNALKMQLEGTEGKSESSNKETKIEGDLYRGDNKNNENLHGSLFVHELDTSNINEEANSETSGFVEKLPIQETIDNSGVKNIFVEKLPTLDNQLGGLLVDDKTNMLEDTSVDEVGEQASNKTGEARASTQQTKSEGLAEQEKQEIKEKTGETDTKPDYSYNTPLDSEKGHWDGERGNSNYVFNPDSKPSSKNYGNLEDKTYREMGKDLGDQEPQVRYEKGNPVFDRDAGTSNGKPLEVEFPEGIDKHIDEKDKISGKVDREKLHEEAFARLAEKYGVSIDELKVFKGDSEPVQRLAQQWGCSEEEVWERCNNPKHIQRVLHEKEDGKTIQLVPRMYHDNASHKGGIEKVVKDYQENAEPKHNGSV